MIPETQKLKLNKIKVLPHACEDKDLLVALVTGCWFTGCWLLGAGCWVLVHWLPFIVYCWGISSAPSS
ncbi:hypothetical protein E1163_12470 [Fulvivirga kasyanovii]|uniref:Uncharacterized protein n=1 Tax=Fulvivirga kasyanovii TaxID=396812 RepID=A0ABW9RPA2_9BACT|nr:hypothetical protein [Fulvivirga kasyanovii]